MGHWATSNGELEGRQLVTLAAVPVVQTVGYSMVQGEYYLLIRPFSQFVFGPPFKGQPSESTYYVYSGLSL